LKLETGRTHQIRVHMSHIRNPLIGDPTYGGRLHIPAGCSPELAEHLRQFRRQALHAAKLGFVHPESGEEVSWEVSAPGDMQLLLDILKRDADA
jgi:23S rRNA pseudouridine1911/1915/1917 synthase